MTYFQPNHGGSSVAKIADNLLLCKSKARSRVLPRATSQSGFLSLSRQLVFSTETVVGFFGLDEFDCLFLVDLDAITLSIRSKVPSQVWAFLPLQSQPAKIIKNE